jgi:hypothetical protein
MRSFLGAQAFLNQPFPKPTVSYNETALGRRSFQ